MKKYKRIILKLSGEALASSTSSISKKILTNILFQVQELQKEYKIEIAIVPGGGNIFRGKISKELGMGDDTAPADYMGMLATSINAIGLTTFFNLNGVKTIMQNSLEIEKVAAKINPKIAIKALEEGKVVIFGGGTGRPYLSTDTAAAERAIEIKADAILMAKNGVDGIYTTDPNFDKNAKFIKQITFAEVIKKDLQVVDHEAMELLEGKGIDILLFNMNTTNNIINLYKDINTKKTIIKE